MNRLKITAIRRGEQNIEGHIVLGDDGVIHADTFIAEELAKKPILWHGRYWNPDDDAAAFMKLLPKAYQGSYVQIVPDNDTDSDDDDDDWRHERQPDGGYRNPKTGEIIWGDQFDPDDDDEEPAKYAAVAPMPPANPKPAIHQLHEFLGNTNGPSNKWIGDDNINAYVRKGRLRHDGKTLTTLDIPNVEVPEELQKQGHFSRFLEAAHAAHPYDATVVENVHNPDLAAFLDKHGWQRTPGEPVSYFQHRGTPALKPKGQTSSRSVEPDDDDVRSANLDEFDLDEIENEYKTLFGDKDED